jgi:hypothetical protein
MSRREIGLAVLCLAIPVFGLAQASSASRSDIIRKLMSEEAAARVDMPLGGEGLLLTDSGEINESKLNKQIQKNGKSIQAGRVVKVTNIDFGGKNIDIELDGGGKEKKGLGGGHVEVGVGVGGRPVAQTPSGTVRAKGSKISLTFANKVPADLTSDQLKALLSPVLDFARKTLVSTNIESLPPEFKEAVLAKEARIGMDQDTVLLAMGIPDRKTSEKVNGIEQEEWQYYGRGVRRTFVTFEKDIVVKVTEY